MSGFAGRDLGLLHETHPLLGRLVVDAGTGRVGVLRAVVRDVPARDGRRRGVVRRAWLRPEGGGVEWTADPAAIREVR